MWIHLVVKKIQSLLERFFDVISKEYSLTKSLVLEITGKNKLLESDRDLRSSVNLRNKTIIPLGVFTSFTVKKTSRPN